MGTAEGATIDFKAVLDPKWPGFRLARQVAAFANAIGGTLLIGAVEEPGTDRLGTYRPLSHDDAVAVEKRYGDAVKDLCSPKPLIDINAIQKDGGVVVAVNVWPFPGQAVGVRARVEQTAPHDRHSTGATTHANATRSPPHRDSRWLHSQRSGSPRYVPVASTGRMEGASDLVRRADKFAHA